MNVDSYTVDLLRVAREAAAVSPGHALSPILDAITVIAATGTAAEFRAAEQLLDGELTASGCHAQTIRPLLEALGVAETRNERWIVACIQRRLGWVYDFAGDDVAALEMIDRARVNFAELDDNEGLTRSLNNLGVLWTRRRDLTEAERVLTEALASADAIGIPLEQARVRVNFGHTCELLGQYERGRRLLEEGHALAASIRHPAQAVALLNLTRIDLAERKPEQAAQTLRRAQLHIDAGNQFAMIEVWLLRGQIAAGEARFIDATDCLATGLKMAEAIGALREQKELWDAVSATHAAAENYKAALDATQRARAIEDSLRRERAVLHAATAVERRAAERAQRDAEQARASEATMRETISQLLEAQRAVERATAEKDRLLVELARQSHEDPLTGLLNRRALDAQLERECALADQHARPLTLALLDIDNFKRINDSKSHAVGDAVLVAIASALRQGRRRSDIVARLGGEEMVLVFAETTLAQSINLCAALRARLAATDWPIAGVDAAVTVSIGLAARLTGETPKALLGRADAAMYAAKAQGKDRVVWEA